jgi:hypothetical protein
VNRDAAIISDNSQSTTHKSANRIANIELTNRRILMLAINLPRSPRTDFAFAGSLIFVRNSEPCCLSGVPAVRESRQVRVFDLTERRDRVEMDEEKHPRV